MLLAHAAPGGQIEPQVPQLRTSLARLVHLPLQQVPAQQTRVKAEVPPTGVLTVTATTPVPAGSTRVEIDLELHPLGLATVHLDAEVVEEQEK